MAGRQGLTGPWAGARTVDHLGALTAAWLEGTGPRPPGYLGSEPDEETGKLVPALAAMNRAGFVTTQSQPAHPECRGWGKHRFEQRAAVEGWVYDRLLLSSIRRRAERAGLEVIAIRPGFTGGPGVPVTRMDGEDVAWFGRFLGHSRQIEYDWPGMPVPVVKALRTSVYLTMVDREWGRVDRLWNTISRNI